MLAGLQHSLLGYSYIFFKARLGGDTTSNGQYIDAVSNNIGLIHSCLRGRRSAADDVLWTADPVKQNIERSENNREQRPSFSTLHFFHSVHYGSANRVGRPVAVIGLHRWPLRVGWELQHWNFAAELAKPE